MAILLNLYYVMLGVCLATCQPFLFLESPWGGVGQFFLGESQSHVYLNKIMCVKFGCGPTVVSTRGGGGTDRQTDKGTAALYSRMCKQKQFQ